MNRRLALVAVTALFASLTALVPAARAHDVSCAGDVQGGEWPMFGGDLQATRNQDKDGVLTAPVVPRWTFDANRWSRDSNNEITGYPVVVDGCVFVGSSTGKASDGRENRPGYVFALNAETGEVVWQTKVPGGVYSTLAVEDGVVYAFVSVIDSPMVVALDQATGAQKWATPVDHQIGSDAVSSPIVYDGMVWVGVSGTAAEGDDADRNAFQGSSVLLDATTGEIIEKIWTIPPGVNNQTWRQGFSGGAQWGTISIDPDTGYGYVPTGNPFNYDAEHPNTNAILKLDLDRNRPTFGTFVGSYKGDVEEFFPQLGEAPLCDEGEELEGVFAAGLECLNLDLDFGATPNLYRDPETGQRLVAAGQKSGVLHIFDADSMEPVKKVPLGVPSAVGGIVGSAAYDGTNLYGPHTLGGYLWSVNATTGATNWVSPTADGVHWGPPVTHANGILWTVDLKGFLLAYDADTGAPLQHVPMNVGSETRENPTFSWGGVTVARNNVFASVGIGLTSAGLPSMPNGFVIAFGPVGPLP